MAEVRAFRALRYDEAVAGPLSDLICPPYDVITAAERTRLAERSPHNFVAVELPDEDPTGYRAADDALALWRASGALRPDPAPSFYVHEHEFALGGTRIVRHGILVALRLHASEENVVLPHERTFPKAKTDRLELLRATRTNTSPVFALVDAPRAVTAIVRAASPIASARYGEDGHRLAVASDPEAVRSFVAALRNLRVYIADGHHRYETALTYANERGAARDSAERFTLASLSSLDDPGLRILATHRVVRGAGDALDRAIARSFESTPIERGALGDLQPGIVFAREGRLLRLEPRADADRSALPAAWRELPVALAEELLLRDAREAGAEVTYEHDAARAIAAAKGGASAVLIRAVDAATLRRVADAGEKLPQKTTYFYPKVPAGLVIRALDLG